MLRRRRADPRDPESGARLLEYAVEPAEVARALSANVAVSTGLLPPDVLWVTVNGARRTVAGYRPPQVTGIWLEGSETPLRVPLPGLILIHQENKSHLYAIRGNPRNPATVLHVAPLPNVSGRVCWGTVPIPALKGNDLTLVWEHLLGSRFANHASTGKSRTHPDDIRKLLLGLEGRRRYPLDDLVPHKKRPSSQRDDDKPSYLTVGDVVGEEREDG